MLIHVTCPGGHATTYLVEEKQAAADLSKGCMHISGTGAAVGATMQACINDICTPLLALLRHPATPSLVNTDMNTRKFVSTYQMLSSARPPVSHCFRCVLPLVAERKKTLRQTCTLSTTA